MKKNELLNGFMLHFNDVREEIDNDITKYSETKHVQLEGLQLGYKVLSHELEIKKYELKGILYFLRDMGYITVDDCYNLSCEVSDYYLEMAKLLDVCEDKLFEKFISDQETETA